MTPLNPEQMCWTKMWNYVPITQVRLLPTPSIRSSLRNYVPYQKWKIGWYPLFRFFITTVSQCRTNLCPNSVRTMQATGVYRRKQQSAKTSLNYSPVSQNPLKRQAILPESVYHYQPSSPMGPPPPQKKTPDFDTIYYGISVRGLLLMWLNTCIKSQYGYE